MQIAPILLLVFLFYFNPCFAAKRVALVIGNGSYASAPLKNAVNDARDIRDALRKAGFEVETIQNGTHRQMENAIISFGRKLRFTGGAGLFYFAGHGIQYHGRNYLLPVDAKIESESDVKFEAVDAGRVLGKMEDAGNEVNIVILDACRNNPFARSFRSAEHGLARMDAPAGSLIAYATGPGSVAADGKGRNGIYTGHLLENLTRPGLPIEKILKNTRKAVMKETNRKQIPWESTSLTGEFIFLANGSFVVDEEQRADHKKPATGSLAVLSEPSGAKVQVGGVKRGTTPLLLDSVAIGTVNIEVSNDGYVRESKQVRINTGRRVSVSFVLQKEQHTGRLTISPTPADAKIRILNIILPYSPGIELDSGRYHVEVFRDGYGTAKNWVELLSGEDLDVEIELEPRKNEPSVSFAKNALTGRVTGRSYVDPATGMEFVYVKGGCYQMGDTFGYWQDSYLTVHRVCVDDFYMGKYEVTQGEYRKVAGSNPSHFKKGDRYPVERVTWDDAQDFIRKLNQRSGKKYRLPTEAEWEYAARSGGKMQKYSGGNSVDAVAWYESNSGSSTHPVGAKQANGLGIYDMSGNVMEWCQDWYGMKYYQFSSNRKNPTGPSSGSYRVERGGSWYNSSECVRAAYRHSDRPISYNNSGFRLVFPVK